jgi:hypothetical protein
MPVTDGYKSLRLPTPFVAKIKRVADEQERSVAKQVMRWCQLGAAAQANPDLTGREILQQYAARKDAIP